MGLPLPAGEVVSTSSHLLGLSLLFHIQGGLLVLGAKGSFMTLKLELEEMVAENPS